MDEALSPEELKNKFTQYSKGKTIQVIDYDVIITLGSLDELFKMNPYIVIFYPSIQQGNVTVGHYTCLIKDTNNMAYYFYDPLAFQIDQYKRYTQRNKLYAEKVNSLVKHLLKDQLKGFDIHYNEYQHQSRKSTVATCGRWCILRCTHYDLTNKEFNTFVNYVWRKLTKSKPPKIKDKLVVQLIQ